MDLKPTSKIGLLKFGLGLLGLLMVSEVSWAQHSCLPAYNSLQIFEQVDASQPVTKTYLLNEGREYRPLVETRIKYSEDKKGSLQMTFKFEDRFQGVSLPFNVFAILVLSQGRVITWLDFTEGCQSTPISFFPGQEITITLDAIPDPQANVQIMVW